MKIFSIIILALSLTGCNDTKKLASDKQLEELNGRWELTSISGASLSLQELYPAAKPFIIFDVVNSRVTGKTGCNNFSGGFSVKDILLQITPPLAMTKMHCPGTGEQVFADALQKVSSYHIDSSVLHLLYEKDESMKFRKVPAEY